MFLTVATEVTPEIPVGNLEILQNIVNFQNTFFLWQSTKKIRLQFIFSIFFTDLQNRINLFFEYHVIELLYFS